LHLFVYGTLRSGFSNPHARRLHAGSTLVGRARVRGRLYDLGRYPGLRLSVDGDDWVTGELYKISDESLVRELDEYEGAEYRRVLAAARLDDGREMQTWVYEHAAPLSEARRIASGEDLRREAN
jgi:gamma-glutamylcyclotransferase (GGCT)/AIG2-like uncharacterized protein YtfP